MVTRGYLKAYLLILIFAVATLFQSATSSLSEQELDEETVSTYSVVLPTRLWKTSAVAVGNLSYIFGGEDATGTPVNTILEFSPDPPGARTTTDVLPTAVHSTAAVLHQSKIYIMGGETTGGKTKAITVFDPNAPEGQRVSSYSKTLPFARSAMSAASDGTSIFLFGGQGSKVHEDIQWFDPSSGSMSGHIGSLPGPRTGTSAVWTGVQILIFGGFDGVNPVDEIIRYNPLRRSWVVVSEWLPMGVHSTAAVWNGERAIVLGGSTMDGPSRDIFVYDPLTATVEIYTGELDGRREAPSAVWINDHVDLFGGRNDTAVSSWIMKFRPPQRIPIDACVTEQTEHSEPIIPVAGTWTATGNKFQDAATGQWYFVIGGTFVSEGLIPLYGSDTAVFEDHGRAPANVSDPASFSAEPVSRVLEFMDETVPAPLEEPSLPTDEPMCFDTTIHIDFASTESQCERKCPKWMFEKFTVDGQEKFRPTDPINIIVRGAPIKFHDKLHADGWSNIDGHWCSSKKYAKFRSHAEVPENFKLDHPMEKDGGCSTHRRHLRIWQMTDWDGIKWTFAGVHWEHTHWKCIYVGTWWCYAEHKVHDFEDSELRVVGKYCGWSEWNVIYGGVHLKNWAKETAHDGSPYYNSGHAGWIRWKGTGGKCWNTGV